MRRHPGRRRALRGLERDLAASDARLAALFQTFTLLARDEMMPRTEKIRRRPLPEFSRARRAERQRMGQQRMGRQRAGRQRAGRRAERRRAEPRRAGDGWRAAVRAIFYGPLALAAAPCGSLCYPLGLGYRRPAHDQWR